MDAVLQNFKRSFRLSTPLFQSLSLDSPAIREELYRRVDRYSMLEDNISVAVQTVMITNEPTEGNKPPERSCPSPRKAKAETKSDPVINHKRRESSRNLPP